MASSSNISTLSPPIFNGENYPMWSVKMEAYLKDLLLWEAIESDFEVEVPKNPTLNQLRMYEDKVSRKYKALSTLHSVVNETIFTRIMACKTAKEV